MSAMSRGLKTKSWGVFTSGSAVQSRPVKDRKKLYFQTTLKGDFKKWNSDREDSVGEIYGIGHRSTKNLPFQYRQTPTHDMSALLYTTDYWAKPSESVINDDLREIYSRPHNGHVGSASCAPGIYRTDFVRHPKRRCHSFPTRENHSLRDVHNRRTKPEIERSQVLSCSDETHVLASSSHRCFAAPPPDFLSKPISPPQDNLCVSGVDTGDCYKSTYGTDFKGLQKSRSRPSGRCSSAPAGARRKDKLTDMETAMESEKADSIRKRPSSCSGTRRKFAQGWETREAKKIADLLNRARF